MLEPSGYSVPHRMNIVSTPSCLIRARDKIAAVNKAHGGTPSVSARC